MSKTIRLLNGEYRNINEDTYNFLADMIYQYLGADCYHLFRSYIDKIINKAVEAIDERDEALAKLTSKKKHYED